MTNLLFFDTETTGLVNRKLDPTDPKQPMPVQLGMKLDAANRNEVGAANFLIKTDGWQINPKATEVTGITNALADAYGLHLVTAYEAFLDYVEAADMLVAHNAAFDVTVMRRCGKVYSEIVGEPYVDPFAETEVMCTMLASIDIVKAPPKRNGTYKWPKLEECMQKFFNESIEGAHDALVDVKATARVYYYLVDTGVFDVEPTRTRNLR